MTNLAPLKPRDRLNAVLGELLGSTGRLDACYLTDGVAVYTDMRTSKRVTLAGAVLGVSQAVTGGDALVMRGPAGTLVHVPLTLLVELEVTR